MDKWGKFLANLNSWENLYKYFYKEPVSSNFIYIKLNQWINERKLNPQSNVGKLSLKREMFKDLCMHVSSLKGQCLRSLSYIHIKGRAYTSFEWIKDIVQEGLVCIHCVLFSLRASKNLHHHWLRIDTGCRLMLI